MSRADDRGSQAATRVHPAPRVTLDWRAAPFTLRGREETKWIREKNGRRLLLTSSGKQKYWRAPRPRPRLHRRQRRRRKKKVIEAALSKDTTPPPNLAEAQAAIQVLQAALRASLEREQKLAQKLQYGIDKTNQLQIKEPGDKQLDRNQEAESGFAGVTRNKTGWAAYTTRRQGERKHLGTFNTPMEASRARRDYLSTQVIATVQQAPHWIPNRVFCIFWSSICIAIISTGIPWYIALIGLIAIYLVLMSMANGDV